MIDKTQYPLQWPIGWRRSTNPGKSRFGTYYNKPTIAHATKELKHNLELLLRGKSGSQEIVISTNLQYKKDGMPYSNQREPDDNGVAVYFMYNKQETVIACDSYDKIGCNLYAIAKTIEAMRGIERWGCSDLLNRAFDSFKALPDVGQSAVKAWWDILEISPDADEEDVKKAYRNKSKLYHPDIPGTGDEIKFAELQGAYQQALNAVK